MTTVKKEDTNMWRSLATPTTKRGDGAMDRGQKKVAKKTEEKVEVEAAA